MCPDDGQAARGQSHRAPRPPARLGRGRDLGVGWVDGGNGRPDRLPPGVVAVRSRFYVDQDDDGTSSDWFERQLNRVEDPSIAIFRQIEDRWPLDDPDRVMLSQFFGLQYLRSPAFHQWHSVAVDEASATPRAKKRSEDVVRAGELHVGSDRGRNVEAVSRLPMIGTLLANMRWTLLRCGSPRLATSDQPLGIVTSGVRQPISAIAHRGIVEIAEARFAVSPTLLLLMTWHDDFGPEVIRRMPNDAVRSHNAVVMGQADVQWFHHPARAPERTCASIKPIVELLPGTDGATPFNTLRHAETKRVTFDVLETEGDARFGIRVADWTSLQISSRRAA